MRNGMFIWFSTVLKPYELITRRKFSDVANSQNGFLEKLYFQVWAAFEIRKQFNFRDFHSFPRKAVRLNPFPSVISTSLVIELCVGCCLTSVLLKLPKESQKVEKHEKHFASHLYQAVWHKTAAKMSHFLLQTLSYTLTVLK